MPRRVVDFIITLTLVALAALAADAQPWRNIPVVGVLEPGPDVTPPRPCLQGFAQGLHQLGYREGHNLHLEYRYADFQPDRLQALAAEFAGLQPDIIFTHSPLGAQVAQQAAPTIPIVVGVATDLVEQGLVASLARPGGNLMGLELRDHELLGKRLELLKQALPRIARVAVLVDPALGAHHRLPGAFEGEARALGLHLQRVEAGDPETFDTAFGTMTEGRADALVLMGGVRFTTHRQRLIELAHRHRLPTMAAGQHFAEAGSLMAYGASAGDLCRRVTVLVDKILEGAKPANLPVEQPTIFELVINLKTAAQLGLTIPPPLVVRNNWIVPHHTYDVEPVAPEFSTVPPSH